MNTEQLAAELIGMTRDQIIAWGWDHGVRLIGFPHCAKRRLVAYVLTRAQEIERAALADASPAPAHGQRARPQQQHTEEIAS